MRAASHHLTPVTLELGGRNAVIVTDNANVELALQEYPGQSLQLQDRHVLP